MHIVIADDHSLIIAGFRKTLNEYDDSLKISAATNKNSLLHILQNEQVDLIFQDLKFGEDDARLFINSIKQNHPAIKIIIISTIVDAPTIQMLRNMDIDGYISKSDDSNELIAAINSIANNQSYWSKEIRDIIYQNKTNNAQLFLTKREKEVLLLIIDGKTTKEIGQLLFLSEKTIETYRSSLFLKFDVTNVASLVKSALLAGFLE